MKRRMDVCLCVTERERVRERERECVGRFIWRTKFQVSFKMGQHFLEHVAELKVCDHHTCVVVGA